MTKFIHGCSEHCSKVMDQSFGMLQLETGLYVTAVLGCSEMMRNMSTLFYHLRTTTRNKSIYIGGRQA